MVTITRRLEFDAGHRIPHHANQCRHLHGHRYALEITVVGALVEVERAGGGRAVYFLLPVAGGETVEVDGREVLVVTPASPIGEAMVGAVRGDDLEVRGPRATVVGVG